MTDIICYYCRTWRVYVVYCVDAEGNQIYDCEYYPTKERLRMAFAK